MFKISESNQTEIDEFLKIHMKDYPEDLQEILQECLYDGETAYDILFQLYSFKKAIPEELDPYYQFVEILKAKYPNLETRKIIEVSCGFIPALSLALTRKINRKNPIDVYDPNLIDIPYPNIKNNKRYFQLDNKSNPDLYISNFPCDALEIIIEKSIKTKKEMMIQTCTCNTNRQFYSYWEEKYYIESLFEKLKQLEDSGFIVEKEKTDLSTLVGHPILIVRKKTM